jgi:hypothetical protein
VDLAYKLRSEKAGAEADKKTVLSAPENGSCSISKSTLPTNDACFLIEVKIAVVAGEPKRDRLKISLDFALTNHMRLRIEGCLEIPERRHMQSLARII